MSSYQQTFNRENLKAQTQHEPQNLHQNLEIIYGSGKLFYSVCPRCPRFHCEEILESSQVARNQEFRKWWNVSMKASARLNRSRRSSNSPSSPGASFLAWYHDVLPKNWDSAVSKRCILTIKPLMDIGRVRPNLVRKVLEGYFEDIV